MNINHIYNDLEEDFYNKHLTKYKKHDINGLYKMYEQFKKMKSKSDIQTPRKGSLTENNQMNIRLHVIRECIENKELEIYDKEDNSYYPNLNDVNFQEKIYLKEEFNVNKVLDKNYTIEDKCSGSDFNLSNYQRFIKTFISPDTPYNGVLLFYGTGVGKTCSAVSIAEQFKNFYNHKIRIILSGSIEDSWKRTIYNPKKDYNQCTKNNYKNVLERENKNNLNKKNTPRQLNKIIKSEYEFYGYQKFSNTVKNIKSKKVKGATGKLKKELEQKAIDETFSNSILIIDEAHNIRLEENNVTDSNGLKDVISIIDEIVTYSRNLKIVLLSATPMFNRASEIIWLLNILLRNDNREPIKHHIFDGNGNLTEKGKDLLIKKSRGYISYVRGEDPISFPLRLYPNMIDKETEIYCKEYNNYPRKTFKGNDINESNMLLFVPLKYSLFQTWQKIVYDKTITKLKHDSLTIMDDTVCSQISNIVYPDFNPGIKKNLNEYYGQKGFLNVFDINRNKFKYKKKIREIYEKDDKFPLLDLKHIHNFSCKISSIIKSIVDPSIKPKSREGLIFIYTRFLWSGAIPLALALEHIGFEKYGNSNLLDYPEYKSSVKETTCKRPPLGHDSRHKIEGKPFKRGKYIILSGDQRFSKNNSKELEVAINDNNVNGEEIKIIIGTEVASEGIDLKYIREVHIMDPWRHLNKIEQIIGRGIRFCSHSKLPLTKRNTTINIHTGVDNPEIESTDTYIYRQAEIKTRQIGHVDRVLKENAIDCPLFINNNIIKPGQLQNISRIITYKNKIGKNIELHDKSFSNICSYMEDCEYSCINKSISYDNKLVNSSTFQPHMIDSLLSEIIRHIKVLYNKEYVYKITDILILLGYNNSYSEEYIKMALNKLLLEGKMFKDKSKNDIINSFSDQNNEYILNDIHGVKGYLILSGNYCIFQPLNFKNDKACMYYRLNNIEHNSKTIPKHIELKSTIDLNIQKQKEEKELIFKMPIEDLVEKEYYSLFREIKLIYNQILIFINKILFKSNKKYANTSPYEDKNLFIRNLKTIIDNTGLIKLLITGISRDKIYNTILGYILDRQKIKQRYIILSTHLYKINNNIRLEPLEKQIYNYFKELFFTKNLNINVSSYEDISKTMDINGFILYNIQTNVKPIVIKPIYFKLLNNNIHIMKTEIRRLDKNIQRYKKDSGRFIWKEQKYYGYIDILFEDNILKFKKPKDKIQSNKLPGHMCGIGSGGSKKDLIGHILSLNKIIHENIKQKDYKYQILCFIIEFILRNKPINSNMFYKFEEVFIRDNII